ncbi:MAG: SWIM zinc finger family protein [Gorillibacterium sp.]|nr:SWIM zinc finger family protein [Gorillibacterium sp.]
MSFYSEYPEYVSVAEKKLRALKTIEKLRKKNPNIAPITLTGTKLVRTWWGKAWNDNLVSYSDYANRIDRGRSYVRHGAVLDLQLTQGQVQALVQGSETKPYKVELLIQPISKEVWAAIIKDCTGKMNSLQELIEGKFPKALADLFKLKGIGLFPAPKEIVLKCSCPDSAKMCKHVAAVLFGVGARLDDNPGLFFELRNVNITDLITETTKQQSQSLLEKSKVKSRRVIADGDMSSIFGIDLDTDADK